MAQRQPLPEELKVALRACPDAVDRARTAIESMAYERALRAYQATVVAFYYTPVCGCATFVRGRPNSTTCASCKGRKPGLRIEKLLTFPRSDVCRYEWGGVAKPVEDGDENKDGDNDWVDLAPHPGLQP